MTEIIKVEEKKEAHVDDYLTVEGQEAGYEEVKKYPGTEGFLRLVHEYAYMIAEQLYDNLGGRLDIQVFTVERWIHYVDLRDEVMTFTPIRIHNTSSHSINSRYMIFQICDNICAVLLKQGSK